jgi:nuclear pore complex protein Nup210
MLKATGGDGSYIWSSRQSSVVNVLQNGSIKILSMGMAEVTVAMARNQYNKDITKIHVLQPSRLKIVQYNMEAAIGEPIHLHIALFGKLINASDVKEIAFSNCRNINFQVHIGNENFVETYEKNVQPIGTACAVITVINHCCVGISDVTVTYNMNENSDNHYLIDNVTVSAYEPLTAIYPESKQTLLAIGSSRNVVFKGGPLPWTNKSQNYLQNIHLSNKQVAEVLKHEVSLNRLFDRAVFTIICKTLGKTVLTYTVSNVPVFSNCQHTHASETIEIVCGKPRYIYLQPEFTDNENCPIGQNTNKIIAHSNKHLKFFVIVKDEDGKRFDNITSLNIEWNLKPSGSGSVEIPSSTMEEIRTDVILENVILPRNHYQNVIFKKHYGVLTMYATITGYQKRILNKLQITPEWPLFFIKNERGGIETPLIETSIEMALVNDTIVTPNKLIILNDSSIKSGLQVNQGSGYYKFVLSSNEIADIQYIEMTRMISVVPRKPGVLRITLVDLCLPSKPAEIRVEVQKLAMIEVDTVNKIEKGKCVTAALKLYDTNGYVVKLPSLNILDFHIEINNGYIEVKQLPASEQGTAPYERILYKIHGMLEGESHLTFVKKGDHEVQSESIIVQVFVPLQVQPSNLTILIGTIYQLQIIGGPPNAEIEYTTENDDILLVDRKGILEGKLAGQTKIRVRAVGFDAKGNKVVYSEDSADVYVLHLEGIKILTPVSRVKTGAIFPLWVFGIPDYLMPVIIGSMQLPLNFAWSSSEPNLLTLHNMYEGTGINIRYQNQVSLRAKAINPGVATIFLNVTVPYSMLSGFNKNDVTYTTFVKIEIFEEMHLIHPVSSKKTLPILLMSPNSVLRLQTDRDKYGTTVYKILSFDNTHGNESEDSHVSTSAMKTVTVNKNGIVRSGENFGQTIISIANTEAYNLKQSLTIIIEVSYVYHVCIHV